MGFKATIAMCFVVGLIVIIPIVSNIDNNGVIEYNCEVLALAQDGNLRVNNPMIGDIYIQNKSSIKYHVGDKILVACIKNKNKNIYEVIQ